MLKNKLFLTLVPIFIAVFAFGFFLGGGTNSVKAETTCTVDRVLLQRIYDAIFHRPLDSGADFHVGRPLDVVLTDIENSSENVNYSGVFKSVKALEEAKRAPGQLSNTDTESYKKIVDSALSQVSAWADTLPEQAIDKSVIGPEQARVAIQRAYDNLNFTAKQVAEYGLFNAQTKIGHPDVLPLPIERKICIQVITTAKNVQTGEVKKFPTPCNVPDGWENVPPVTTTQPAPSSMPTCLSRPACLDSIPRCLPPEPIGGWCSTPSPTQ